MYIVYVVVNKANGNMYVGYTEQTLENRWKCHVDKARREATCPLGQAIMVFGADKFDIRMIEEYITKQEMWRGEIEYIAYFDTYKTPHGYNATRGGPGGNTNGGKKFDAEWRVGISRSLGGKGRKNRRRFSEEVEREICRLYVEEGKSCYGLGQEYKCSKLTITAILMRNDIAIRKSKCFDRTKHSNGRNIFSLEQELEMCRLYQEDKVSRHELARKFGCGSTTARDILLRHNVKLGDN